MEHWPSLLDPSADLPLDSERVRYTVTLFYDQNKEPGKPTYPLRTVLPPDRVYWDISLMEDGRLCKQALGGRWRTVDESGTGIRAGSNRPPEVPRDAFSLMQKGTNNKMKQLSGPGYGASSNPWVLD